VIDRPVLPATHSRHGSLSKGRTHLEPWGTSMEIEVEKIDKDAVIKLSGRLDINTSPDLRRAALALYTKGGRRNLRIDFAEVSFIDTSGLATLLEILVAAKEQRKQLTLSGLNEKVRYLIDVNGLTGFFRIRSSERERSHV
jgi:anti-sigma B factor antagonist